VSKKTLEILSEVKTIDSTIPDEPGTAKVVNDWTTRAYAGFQEKGFNPSEVVTTLKEPLDGRESSIRYRQTNLGAVVAKAMLAASKKSQIAIFNSGSIRLDDQLLGTITQYDIIRTLPFGGKTFEVEMKGSLLQRVLEAGAKNIGRGGFLQYEGVVFDSTSKTWNAGGKTLDANTKYVVIVSDYLFSGNEQGIEFFKKENVDVVSVSEPNTTDPNDVRKDIRLSVIAFLKRL
jgi:5'-nucleotidase